MGQSVKELRGYVLMLVAIGDYECDLGLCLVTEPVTTSDGDELAVELDHEGDTIHRMNAGEVREPRQS